MPTPLTFTTNYSVGDTVYIFFDDGSAGTAEITDIGFREGFDPNSFVANTDFIYTTNKLQRDGVTYISRSQAYCFASKNTMSAYVLTLP